MEIPNEVKLQLLNNEVVSHKQAVYVLSIRHRVNKKLGHTPEQLKALEEDIAKSEMAIDELEKVIKELDG